MASAVSDVTFNSPEEFFIHCAENELLPRIFDHIQVDSLVAEYKIPPEWIDDIHANNLAYFEAYLNKTGQIHTIYQVVQKDGQEEPEAQKFTLEEIEAQVIAQEELEAQEIAIEHIIHSTLIPDLAIQWVEKLRANFLHDIAEFYEDLVDDFVEPAATAMPDCLYGTSCKRSDCRFTHPRAHATQPSALTAPATSPSATAMPDCRFGDSCNRRGVCRFNHPRAHATLPSAQTAPDAHTIRPSAPTIRQSAPTIRPSAPIAHTAPIACLFQNSCTKRNCTYTHPGVPCNSRPCMSGNNCYKQGKTCQYHHPSDTCQH